MGVAQFTQFATVSLSAKSVLFNPTATATVPAGGSETFTFYAAANTLCKTTVVVANVPIVPGGLSTEATKIYLNIASVGWAFLSGPCTQNVQFSGTAVTVAGTESEPAINQPMSMASLIFDSVAGASVQYTNGSASAQTAARQYIWATIQEAII